MWKAVAEYANGTRIEKCFPYQERGIWTLENERQYDLEWRPPGLFSFCLSSVKINQKRGCNRFCIVCRMFSHLR